MHIYAVRADRYAQEKTLTVELQDKMVGEVLDYIEKNSEFIFFYYNKAVDTQRRVSLSVKDKPITVVFGPACSKAQTYSTRSTTGRFP